TQNVVVSFDPDIAGTNATEKTLALLTEEGLRVKIVNRSFRESGMDPDRFVREMGAAEFQAAIDAQDRGPNSPKQRTREEMLQAIRGAQWYDDYLIERAKQLFPGNTADQKVKAMNFLLPHIRRIPEKLARDQFAADAAQKLGIDSAVLREELRQAALKRRERVETRPEALTKIDVVLLRTLASTEIEEADQRRLAAKALQEQPSWFEHLVSFPALQILAVREAKDPMEVVDDSDQKALLAEALFRETRMTVEGALQELEERSAESRLRNLRAQIAEAERRADYAELAVLTQQKLDLDRALRQLHFRNPLDQ
ncbi:MAG: toprim domain-containing protein, partial [Terracidiphilus sp.]